MLQPTPPDALDRFDAGQVKLERSGVLREARLVYATWGRLAPARDNVIVMPTYYNGTHQDNARLIGAGRALDPAH